MKELDKTALGERIRKIRSQAGLRQWELARLLGTTQSAVHKYEHGVVPEPRRLVELAGIGNTSIEWILTGHHWENGSDEQRRVTPDLLQTACALRQLAQEERESVDDALRVFQDAVRVLALAGDDGPAPGLDALASALREHSGETLKLLETAWRIQRAVLARVTKDAAERLASSPLLDDAPPGAGGKNDERKAQPSK